MIGPEGEARLHRVDRADSAPRLGGPLAMLAMVLAVWGTGRAMLWQDPFAMQDVVAGASALLAGSGEDFGERSAQSAAPLSGYLAEAPNGGLTPGPKPGFMPGLQRAALDWGDTGPGPAFAGAAMQTVRGHHLLWQAALGTGMGRGPWQSRLAGFEQRGETQAEVPVFPGNPPFAARASAVAANRKADRWSLDAWAFVREQPGTALTPQGRVPVYGASQIGANLQYRIAPANRHDPRLYLRTYRALIDQPESELAAGMSARPLARVPVRLAAELRLIDNAFQTELRPAAYGITQLPPVKLPLGLAAEVYGGAGYVGGAADTPFVDGQASVTGKLASFDLQREDDMRLSVGAGAWGGAQRDADRFDIGPTMRLDLSLGDVPARLSVDYRERLSGDAVPDSGFAATLSTRF